MKNLFATLLLLFLAISLFSQTTTHGDLVKIINSSYNYPGIEIFAYDAVNSSSTSHPIFDFKSSGGASTAKSAIIGGKSLGSLIWSGYDSNVYFQAARIQVNTLSNFSTSSHQVRMDFNVGGQSKTRMSIDGTNGNVGIGTEAPRKQLEIEGGNDLGIRLFNNNANFWDINNSTHGKLDFVRGGSNIFMRIDQIGRVGIGTKNPSELLTVKGKILCGEVNVVLESTIPADYVFQKYYTGFSALKSDYVMPTLEEIEAFTKANHHLPEVPSAAEVKEDGLQLKEMTNLLLQKIEELTLYTIEQEKRIKALEEKLIKKDNHNNTSSCLEFWLKSRS